jgi:hypothetical protein
MERAAAVMADRAAMEVVATVLVVVVAMHHRAGLLR